MKRLKIGIITHNFPQTENDRKNAGIFVYDFAKALAKKAEVIVLSSGEKNETKKISGLKTYFFEFKDRLGSLKVYNPYHLLKMLSFFSKGKKTLDLFYRENSDINFIVSMWAFPGGDLANYYYKKYEIPYAVYCLGSDIYIYARKPFLKGLIKKYLKEAQILLADSPDLAKETKKIAGKYVYFLPSASNFPIIEKIKRSDTEKIVLSFLGRLEKVKGIDLLIEALSSLGKMQAEFLINIIGEGTLHDWLKLKTKDMKNIKLWGNLNDTKKISSIIKNSHWLVIPSRSDSIPLVFSESMKLSTPVITSDLPDLKYLVNKYKVGFLFKNNSASDLVRVLKKVRDKKSNYSNFEKNTTQVARIFDLDNTSDKLLSLISKNG